MYVISISFNVIYFYTNILSLKTNGIYIHFSIFIYHYIDVYEFLKIIALAQMVLKQNHQNRSF
jgi:hypothetical protein